MARSIMIQGTMSNAGKSIITTGLCRVFAQDGYKVAPFKSQNMALNSFITEEGLEMGRAQVVQAEACMRKPCVEMNPILLKPTSDMGSQVIVLGKVQGNMRAMDYYKKKTDYIPIIKQAYDRLAKDSDIVVIEGAGSPVEINLKENDIVNMGMAKLANANVLLVGDIDRGGVFAQLLGTLELLEADERELVKGLIVNKFRGDVEILKPGITMLEEKCKKPVFGVVPYADIIIEEEDSLANELSVKKARGGIDIAVIKLRKLSNFTDLLSLSIEDDISVRYVENVRELGTPDLLIIPGSKNTIEDMKWLKESGLSDGIVKLASHKVPIIGICGGYQLLGMKIKDPYGVECGGEIAGLGLLPVETILSKEKTQKQSEGIVNLIPDDSAFMMLSNATVKGYEIHMGKTVYLSEDAKPFLKTENSMDGCIKDHIIGTYFHGLFDYEDFKGQFMEVLYQMCGHKKQNSSIISLQDFKEQQYNQLADILRNSLNMKEIYKSLK